MNIVERYENLKVKAIRLKSQIEQHYSTAKDIKAQYDEKTKQLENEKDSLNVQNFAIDTLKEIMDKLSQEHVEKVVSLLTYALSVVFHDKNYSVEIVTSDKRNVKTADLILVERTEDKVLRSEFNDSIGGGILAVVGLVLQIYYCNVLGQAPVLFMDEALSQVSSEYVVTLMMFIKELAEKKDLIIVLISHDERYMNYADRTYMVDDGEVKEVGHGK